MISLTYARALTLLAKALLTFFHGTAEATFLLILRTGFIKLPLLKFVLNFSPPRKFGVGCVQILYLPQP
jgi:hypothetical protein